MSKDKYPSIFSPQIATIVFIILLIFFAMCAVLKIGEYSWIFPSFSWGIFGHVTRLGQSRVKQNDLMDYNSGYNMNERGRTAARLHEFFWCWRGGGEEWRLR